MSINIDLPKKTISTVSHALNTLLADEYVLFTKTYNYHWNVTGSHFHDLHKMLEGQYRTLLEVVDDVAERVRSLDAPAYGTLTQFLKETRLKEKSGNLPAALDMLKNLLADHESIIRSIREDMVNTISGHKDIGTENFLSGLIEKHEKMAWMLRATVSK